MEYILPLKIINVAEEITGQEDKNNYYKQYFKTKQSAYKDVPEDNAILTDVEAYYTSETLDEEGYVITEEQEYGSEYNEGNGAWGSNSTQVSINVYGGMAYAPFYGGWETLLWIWLGKPLLWWLGKSLLWIWLGKPLLWIWLGKSLLWIWLGKPYYGYSGYHGGYGYAYNRGRRNTDYLAGRSYSRGSNSATIIIEEPITGVIQVVLVSLTQEEEVLILHQDLTEDPELIIVV